MEHQDLYPEPRRNFLRNIAAGSVALAAGGLSLPARAASNPQPAKRTSNVDWLDRIHGEHRQVFDLVEPNHGLGAAYAMNYLTSFSGMDGISDDDVCAVTVFRHNAFSLTLKDGMWEKYKLGEFLGVTDPATQAPAVRNIFRANVPLQPGLTYEQMISDKGVIIVACNLALSVHSMMTAPNAGVSAAEAEAEWMDNLLDGVELVPSGVYGVNRAQAHGCTYCYAG